jgi:DMSO/TMAO reductase YedYZ heme-binding membrane subunit
VVRGPGGRDRGLGAGRQLRDLGTGAVDPRARAAAPPRLAVRPPSVPGRAALIFTGIHVGAILFDTYVHFSVINVLVPFTSTWRPTAVAWGIASFYLILAVELTSLARRYISQQVWRRVHFASFVLFVTSSVHALTAGTEASLAPFRLAVVAACGAVGVLTAIRVGRSLYPKAQPRPVAVALD